MGASTADLRVPVEEYLSTSYEPDREYVDGVLIERNVGEYDHSLLQTAIAAYFHARRREWNLRAFTEQRVRVSERPVVYRIPDVCVLPMPHQRSPVLMEPPLIAIEILSPDDRWRDVMEKVDDYRNFGVRHIWIVDPAERKLWTADAHGVHEAASTSVAVPELRGTVEFAEIFADLD